MTRRQLPIGIQDFRTIWVFHGKVATHSTLKVATDSTAKLPLIPR